METTKDDTNQFKKQAHNIHKKKLKKLSNTIRQHSKTASNESKQSIQRYKQAIENNVNILPESTILQLNTTFGVFDYNHNKKEERRRKECTRSKGAKTR